MIKQHMKIFPFDIYLHRFFCVYVTLCVCICLFAYIVMNIIHCLLDVDIRQFSVHPYRIFAFFFTNFKNTQASLNHIIPIIDCMQLSGKRLSDFNLHTNIICFWHTVLTILFTTRSMKWALIVRARKYINK